MIITFFCLNVIFQNEIQLKFVQGRYGGEAAAFRNFLIKHLNFFATLTGVTIPSVFYGIRETPYVKAVSHYCVSYSACQRMKNITHTLENSDMR